MIETIDTRNEVEIRFWSYVRIGDPDKCWPWHSASFDERGYGAFSVIRYLQERAHRFAFQISRRRALGRDEKVRHSCDNPPCCNPGHLLSGTDADNIRDRDARGRTARGERSGSTLTASMVKEIRADPRVSRELAAQIGISKSTVNNIRARKYWGHIA